MGKPIMKRLTSSLAAIAVLMFATSAVQAHHSARMFEAIPTWVKGTVVRYDAVNPHSIIVLEQSTEGGRTQQWTVEGPSLPRLGRMNAGADFIKAGDIIEICAFRLDEGMFQTAFPDRGAAPRWFAHGQVLVMTDGRMQSWGPYGKLVNCVRPDDETRIWADFLNADALGHTAWCNGQAFVRLPTIAPAAFVDEVNGLLTVRCN
jgi:hypothetical protein